jgi:hypothetical protein
MRNRISPWFAAMMLSVAGAASAADIDVMTQNQYLGADIAPLIGAIAGGDPGEFNSALVTALEQIAANRPRERFAALATLIQKRQPHLVGLQEVWQFTCIPLADLTPALPAGYPCAGSAIQGAFNDHLEGTLAALGTRYDDVAYVQNFAVDAYFLPDGTPVPGIPFYYNGVPALLQVQDRDVILARDDVTTEIVDFSCSRPSEDGCNFDDDLPLGPLGSVERGFIAVDAAVGGIDYRFFNTHLEVQGLAIPAGEIQSLQAAQLIDVILDTPTDRQLIIVGDMNSSPNDPATSLPTPYMQFQQAGLFDIWNLRPGATAGMSCCQAEDLSNKVSLLNQRIDLIFTREMPRKVKEARLLGEVAADRTRPPGNGLWPSDHASVAARLQY